jgi:putative ABC transport system substrate-binding protein
LAIEATAGNVHNAAEIEQVITSFAQKPNGGLVVLPHAPTIFNASAIIALAQRYRMPDVHALAEAVRAGGLVSYGLNWDDQFRRAAEYVDRILKGTKPADLPVEQPTKFELVINLKTAKTIGLDVPWFLQQRADEVIE